MNKEERKEYNRRYYQKHKSVLKEKTKEYYLNNKEDIKRKQSHYNSEHKEEIKTYKQKWYQENKTAIKEKSKERYKYNKTTKERRALNLLCCYRDSEKRHDRDNCTLTKDWIIENIFNSSCVYCGESDWTKLGCDRIDDKLPHTPENCVCACKNCNVDRYYRRMSVSEYKAFKQNVS